MRREIGALSPFRPAEPARTSIWIALVAESSVLFGLALASATPFPALATIAAGMRISRRDALALIGLLGS